MTRPITDLLTTDTALTACNSARTSLYAALAKTLDGTKEEKKLALKALRQAEVNYNMTLLNLHRTMDRERSEG